MTRSGIVVAGILCLDVVNIIEDWPDEEQISFIRDTILAPGGPAHNAAAGLVKLGAPFPVTMIGAVGDDAYGDTLIAKAGSYGLDTSHLLRKTGARTSYTLVMTSARTGRRTFFVEVGVNSTLTADQLLPPDDSARIFYLGSPGLSNSMDEGDGWRTVLRAVRKRGFRTAMELCPVPGDLQKKYVRPILPLLDYLVINDSEAEAVSGMTVTTGTHFDWRTSERACRKLMDMGVNNTVIIHHPEGAIGIDAAGAIVRAPSVNVPEDEIIGSVGAGDAFYSGVLFGLHEDWPLARCLELGNAVAAISLHAATTSASIRPWAECLDYAAAKGLRSI